MRHVDMKTKLRRLKDGRSYAEIARQINCSSENVRKIFDAGSEPAFRRGVALASVLGVSAEWLADDGADWPPPTSSEQEVADVVRDAMTAAGLAGELAADEREVVAALRSLDHAARREVLGYVRGLSARSARSAGATSPGEIAGTGSEAITDHIVHRVRRADAPDPGRKAPEERRRSGEGPA